ncbi:MAG: 3-hydroxyacyl-CoA dehydrogenase NAD-binding domain-containing protein, partial [Pseudomonadota bacterium]
STDIATVGPADLVIEAVFEDLATKRAIFRELDSRTRPGALLATNTSYLDVDAIAEAAPKRAAEILGLHFFSPAHVMPLLEVVRATQTSPEALATAMGLARRLGKTGVVAGLCDGFIGNRMYAGYVREAEFLLEEGATPEQIDRALTGFGMAMGPFAVRDLAGLDIGWARRKATAKDRDPGQRYSRIGDLICQRGWFGQKSGRGFYRYETGSRTPIPDPEVEKLIHDEARLNTIVRRHLTDAEIIDRCLLTIVNEGAKILAEGVAQRSSDIDLVWTNGYGFPRWRGGPMYWAEQRGLGDVMSRIHAFDAAHDFWQPAPLLERAADGNGTLDGTRGQDA